MAIEVSAYNQYTSNNAVLSTNGTQSAPANDIPVINSERLNPGDVISGEVVEAKNGNVSLKLDNNTVLNAELDNNMSLAVGQKLLFQVSSNGEQTTLRPLYTNLANNPAANAALKEAGLPNTATNLAMVSSMMDEGMSVNRQALLNMSRSVYANPTVNPATIVEMSKLSLDITNANIEQYENYKSLEHQIINDVSDLSSSLSNMIGSKAVNSSLLEEGFVSVINSGGSNEFLNEISLKLTNDILSLLESGDKDWNSLLNNPGVSTTAQQTVGVAMAQAVAIEMQDNVSSVVEKVWAINLNPDSEGSGNMNTSVDLGEATTSDASSMMSGDQLSGGANDLMKNFQNDLSKLGMPADELNKIANGTMSVTDMIDFVKTLINNEINYNSLSSMQKDTLTQLLNNKDFKQLVGDLLMKQYVLDPRDVAKDGEVEELYRRLSEQSSRVMEILKDSGLENSDAMRSAQNINDNVNFMNQINQYAAYVQLPVRMNQENAHGELYVYRRKKSLVNKDGNVSAFLHLDMDNLGPMDVYVAMQNNKVNTNFYLADDSALDLIEANIDMLNDRLTKKGYNMSAQILKKNPMEQPKTVISEMLKDKANGAVGGAIASRLSFDVRA